MSNFYFQFKQFTVWHDKCGMKVGTDGVLLGSWVRVAAARRILDVGTGTGLLALMMAQRSDATIVALDVDKNAVCQARENVSGSPWKNRISILESDFREYMPDEKFDVIVSNPPYFVDSLISPDRQRTMARHSSGLTYNELLVGVSSLLSDEGEFNVVVPADTAPMFIDKARMYGLYPARQLLVKTKPGDIPKRALIVFSFIEKECKTDELLTELARHKYSSQYIALTRDYYLNM
ncbi:methyltransferase [uncultured Bacteroides sp.]|uniref:tRNA1(Val) (adenine(37)-N6)-methyltransferase n=1 Tax=uncultured Bacteroides sp. TaxID=162156 RepID=UPI002AA88319|nr:methyltransferase [uncultured Bacteroides sp.]